MMLKLILSTDVTSVFFAHRDPKHLIGNLEFELNKKYVVIKFKKDKRHDVSTKTKAITFRRSDTNKRPTNRTSNKNYLS